MKNLDKITNDQKEIKKRCVDVIYNIPKALKIISSIIYEKTIILPINFVLDKVYQIKNYAFDMCRKKKKD